jgi:hypothetical protein
MACGVVGGPRRRGTDRRMGVRLGPGVLRGVVRPPDERAFWPAVLMVMRLADWGVVVGLRRSLPSW